MATGVTAAFDFKKWNDTTRTYTSVTNTEAKLNIAKENSPIYAVSPDDPPVLIVHGDADRVVPIQQSESIIKKFGEAKVPNNFIIKKGGAHGWRNPETELKSFVDWFDKYLK
jgi:dipeptidyl aminopeptidase/acylaminoacyl peptidase